MKRTSLAALVATSLVVTMTQVGHAAWPVFDVTNYSQNVIQTARALEQINNQVRSLQNQATILHNMARHLQRLDFSSAGQIMSALNRIDGLMIQAEGLGFELAQLEAQWQQYYPDSYADDVRASDMAEAARARLQNAMHAFRRSMRVQAQIAANIRDDGILLADLINRSQGAAGHLEAQQAANQLIALSAKQQMQVQTLMAAQYRVEAEEMARHAQAEEAARVTTTRFIGSGKAYSDN